MKSRQISFSPPDITEAEIEEVAEALRSGWITTGPRTKKLEAQIAEFCHTSKAVCLNSATAALELTLRVLGIGEGDEVITSAYTYTASASVIDHVGAKIVLVDTAKDSFEMDYDALAKAITEKTKAIIPVDLGGVPCDYAKLKAIVESKKGLFQPHNEIQKAIGRVAITADAAHAFGAEYNGQPIGSVADFTSFSFHAVKNFTTAEGGAVVWNDMDGVDNEALYHQYQLLSLHGQSKDALAKTKLGAWEYDIKGPWYKCNMTDIMAALGLVQMKRYPAMLERRKEIIGKYPVAFMTTCTDAIKWSEELAEKWLRNVNPDIDINIFKDTFINHSHSYSHSRRIQRSECRKAGLQIQDLEDNQDLQEAVLSLHHCLMILMDIAPILKFVTNQEGRLYLQTKSKEEK